MQIYDRQNDFQQSKWKKYLLHTFRTDEIFVRIIDIGTGTIYI